MQFKTVAFEPVVSLYTAALLCTQTEPKQTKKEKQKKNMESYSQILCGWL